MWFPCGSQSVDGIAREIETRKKQRGIKKLLKKKRNWSILETRINAGFVSSMRVIASGKYLESMSGSFLTRKSISKNADV